jgi:hypothetical protein
VTAAFSYTLSRLIDDVPENSSGLGSIVSSPAGLAGFAQNPLDLIAERGWSNLNREHAFTGNFVWTLPVMRAQNGFLGRLLGGWQASGIVELGSGTRYTPLQALGGGSVRCARSK